MLMRREGETDTETQRRWRQKWCNVSTSQRMLRIAGSHQKLRESFGVDSPSKPPGRSNAAVSQLQT